MVQLQHVETEISIRGDKMRKVQSDSVPPEIRKEGTQVWLRRNVEEVQREIDGEIHNGYEYDEIVVDGYSLKFATKWQEDIWAHPEKYNVLMENGGYTQRKGREFAMLQEIEDLRELDDVVDQLIVDSLEGLI